MNKNIHILPDENGCQNRKRILVELKKTLEEASENYFRSKEWMQNSASEWVQTTFKAGAKYQAELMYSEEEVKEIAIKFFHHWYNVKGNTPEEAFDKWFEQFKKK